MKRNRTLVYWTCPRCQVTWNEDGGVIMKGDKVVVRAYGDEPVVCRVWEITPDVIFICSEDNYRALSNGGSGLWPVGIPRANVFAYRPEFGVDFLEKLRDNPAIWGQLSLYEATEE